MSKKIIGIALTLCILVTSCLSGMALVSAAETNHGLYIDTTGCSSWSTVVLEKAVYDQPVGEYTVDFDYYTEESAGNSRISLRSSGNKSEYNGASDATKFEKGKWLHHTTTIANENTAIQIKIYFWPGFKGYIDNIVLTNSNGKTSIELDFDASTTGIGQLGGAAGLKAEIKECPVVPDPNANHGIYIDTTGCSGHSTIVLDKAVYNQLAGDGVNYTVSFKYYTEESTDKSRLNIRTSGNNGESAADLYCTTFKKGEWLEYSSTIPNQKNTAIQLKFYIWPGFKGYIDDIVLTDSEGNTSIELDFEENTASIARTGDDSNIKAEIKDCPGVAIQYDNHGLYVNTKNCTNHSTITLDALVENQSAGEYTVEFFYYTISAGDKGRLNLRFKGEKENAADLYQTTFAKNAWLKYSSKINNENSSFNLKFYAWPSFEGYIDNIVIKNASGAVVLKVDFDENKAEVKATGDDANVQAKVAGCPKPFNPDANHGIYVDTTGCKGMASIVLEKAVYGQPVGEYTFDFDYYTLESTKDSKIIPASTGNVNDFSGKLEATTFKQNEWVHYSAKVDNQNTAIMIKFFVYPGFKGYIDNIVLINSKGNPSIKLDFDENTTVLVGNPKDDQNIKAEIDECPDTPKEVVNQGLYINTTACTNHSSIVLEKAIYNQVEGKYKIEFDYYTIQSGAKSRLNARTSGNVGEYQGDFDATVFEKDTWMHYSASIPNKNTAIMIKLYAWPGFEGYIDNIVLTAPDGTVAMTLDFDANPTTIHSTHDDSKLSTEIKDAPEFSLEDDKEDGKEEDKEDNKEEEAPAGEPKMIKQENYKYREDKGGTLSYQAFAQHLGKELNGSEIKPNTTYIFTMDYYCFPGENGTGVGSSTVNIRTLYTGHNATFTAPNQDMIYDKGAGRYKGVLLENVGRHTMRIEFKTLPEQTDLLVMLQSGWDGDAYIWNMKLVEKGGNGTNLLKRTELTGTWADETINWNLPTDDRTLWTVSAESADGKGTYSFVKFNKAIANLAEGEVLSEDGVTDEEIEGPAINVQDPDADGENEGSADTDSDNADNAGDKNGLPVLVIVIIIVAGAVLLIGGGILAFVLIKKAKK